MKQLTGMDIMHVRRLADQMWREAADIRKEMHAMSSLIDNIPWRGHDRDRFVGEWRTRHLAALQRIVDGLEQASRDAKEHARRQEAASSGW